MKKLSQVGREFLIPEFVSVSWSRAAPSTCPPPVIPKECEGGLPLIVWPPFALSLLLLWLPGCMGLL